MDEVKDFAILSNYKGYRNQPVMIDDMPNQDMKDIAEICGVEAAIKLLMNFGGLRINIPANGLNILEKRIILNEFDGHAQSIKKLASSLGTTEKTVRDILKIYQLVPVEGQLNLFPEGWSKVERK